jgi:hypothetical protein
VKRFEVRISLILPLVLFLARHNECIIQTRMNEWASKLLSPLQGISDRNKADFDQFIVEVSDG